MLRWMISPIVDDPVFENTKTAAVLLLSPNAFASAIIPSDLSGTPETNANYGKPKYRFALCLVTTANISLIEAVQNAYVFPDYHLDGRMDGMNADARLALQQSVQAYDLDGNGLHFDAIHTNSDSYRVLIESLAHQLDPGANINAMSCGEVSA